jgi:hypothetical protein
METYIELLQLKKRDSTLSDIEPLVGDLLGVMVDEQSSESYENRFFDVWVQIFTSILFLVQ